ncbi:MAG: hypothetical protein AMS22_02185 [Thiotrichales bacterium SG8_50]|nr:MAG: hypothetical protein AMS22_02185 [Thiotrichales bacterium SG8_50]
MSVLQRYLLLIPVGVLAIGSIVASGGGGGGGDGDPGVTRTVSATCPPLDVGDTWTNLVTQTFMGVTDSWTETVTVLSNDGTEVVIQQTGDGYLGAAYTQATVFEISEDSASEVGADDGEYTFEPQVPLCPKPDTGSSFEQIEADGDLRTSWTVTAVTEGAVDVAAGTFDAIKTVSEVEEYFVTPPLLFTDTEWYADGIGPVKRLAVSTDFSYLVELQCYDFATSGVSGGACGDAPAPVPGPDGDPGSVSPLSYSGTDLDGLGDGVVTPTSYPLRDLTELMESDISTWLEQGSFPDPQLNVSLFWTGGELGSVAFIVTLYSADNELLQRYVNSASCSTLPDVCAAVSFDDVDQTVTFDNVVLPVGNSLALNLATAPVTLNGTLPMSAP